jgi:quercetin dioxygenase-like cupin family protein
MLKTTVAFCVGLAFATAAQAQVNSQDLKWGPAPAMFPKGATIAVLSGDPAKAGPTTVRMTMPPGYQIPAHHHPTTEYVTVISGNLHLGMGDKLDMTKAAALTAGGFAEAPAGMNHYAWSQGGAVVQVHAQGPLEIVYVNPADDPRKK